MRIRCQANWTMSDACQQSSETCSSWELPTRNVPIFVKDEIRQTHDGKAVGRVGKYSTSRVDFEPIAALQSYRPLRNWSLCVSWGKASWKIGRWKMVCRDFGQRKIFHVSIKGSPPKTLKPNRIIFRWKSALRRGKTNAGANIHKRFSFYSMEKPSKRRWLMRRNVVGGQLLTKVLAVHERRSKLYWDTCYDRDE